ncbi:MAG TPA: hypothetical protein DCZ75_09355 [Geobacter sp.]|nr:hypothetical protein [Geobacter sp.]
MPRSIFSWIYPPTCFGLPELESRRCALCGNLCVDCTCPECEHPVFTGEQEGKCGVRGCLEHLLDRDLVAWIEVLDNRLTSLREEAQRREVPTLPCPECGEVQMINIYNGGPYLCHGHFYAGEKYGWMRKEQY